MFELGDKVTIIEGVDKGRSGEIVDIEGELLTLEVDVDSIPHTIVKHRDMVKPVKEFEPTFDEADIDWNAIRGR